MRKIHLDTDIGGEIDDLCALATLLRWPDVEITGITTAADDAGRRAAHLDYAPPSIAFNACSICSAYSRSPSCAQIASACSYATRAR